MATELMSAITSANNLVGANGDDETWSEETEQTPQRRVGVTTTAWQSAFPSEGQSDVEVYGTEGEPQADSLTDRATDSSYSGPLPTTASKNRRAHHTKTRRANDGFEDIIGTSGPLQEVLELVRTVASTNSTLLIEGETGTGKELIARAVHEHSSRRGCPFVRLNCAAIPLGLLESELFGYERGAFTGAVARKVGRFELADRGTLFLDEIGEFPLELQVKLLHILQEREFERLGGTQTLRVNVRLIAATNCNLEALVSQKRFRSDLYYRLNVFPIPVPSLRDRVDDIPLLVLHFLRKFADQMGKKIDEVPTEVMEALVSHPWPGNIRELENFIERSVILTSGNVMRPPLESLKRPVELESPAPITLAEAERDHIRRTLESTRWVVAGPNGAAARLSIKRSTLYFRMQKLGISRFNGNPLV